MSKVFVSLRALAETVVPFRTSEYIEALVEKLHSEGITHPSDLLLTSEQALEKKLSTHAGFN